MSCVQFIGNLEGLNDGQDFPKDLLKVGKCKHTHKQILQYLWGPFNNIMIYAAK